MAKIVRPADPPSLAAAAAKAADDGFQTVPLFQSRKIRNEASLDFVLAQVLAFCDSRQLPRPQMLTGAATHFPCRIILSERRNRATDERIGRMQVVHDDGTGLLDVRWQIALPRV